MSEVAEKKERRYGAWKGHPRGNAEDKTRCVEEVYPVGRGFGSFIGHQCSRKRGHGENGEYCSIHARDTSKISPLRSDKWYKQPK